MLAPGSAVPLKVGVVTLVMLSVVELPVSLALASATVTVVTVSTLNAVPLTVAVLPDTSVTVTTGV